jgi:catechol 2,3-dioxygenase
MDAPNPSAIPTAASRAPLHIGSVSMVVRDLDRMTAYYRDLLGLAVQEQTQTSVKLGTGGVTLFELIHRPDALPDDQRKAGLYHNAFLMPTRADLARWILHASKSRVPITGASDHDVSEAIYLDDPEGNGVEVYADRPREKWRRDGSMIFQKTEALDLDAIVAEVDRATANYSSAPGGLRIGHIHLRVGDIAKAENFYCDVLGFEVTRRRNGASFVSSEGYHHHVAVNTWHSNGARQRNARRAGLDWFTVEVKDPPTMDGLKKRLGAAGIKTDTIPGGLAAMDPWGNRVHFTIAV